MSDIINIIWFDKNYVNFENSLYLNDLKRNGNLIIKCYKEIKKGIEYIKTIFFQETNIIISGKLYSEFISEFKNNLIFFNVIPKITIFTDSKLEFLKYNNVYINYVENSFYNYGGVQILYSEVKNIIFNQIKRNSPDLKQLESLILSLPINKNSSPNKFAQEELGDLTFQYIDSKGELYYPMFYQSLIEEIKIEQLDLYTEFLYNKYNNSIIHNLLNSIRNISKIPIELISKYYARLFTAQSDFYKNINKDLRENKKDNYLIYIKTLYQGVKTKSLLLASNNILYRGASLLKKEIQIIEGYLKNKKEGLPGVIVFSKTFLSFSKSKEVAEEFLKYQNDDNKLNKILFILENENNLDYSLSTHADIEKISYIPKEKEVLFFPFSSFEIKEIKEDNNRYEMYLKYLGKYLKELEKNEDDNIIPNSEFQKQMIEFGLIEKVKGKVTSKFILEKYIQYKNEINNINYIIGELKIGVKDLNKDIRLINSYDQYNKRKKNNNVNDIYKNEKEIIENIEIKINDETIPFSYFFKFQKNGEYTIKYSFKNKLTKSNFMFSECYSLTNIDLSNFNTKNIINMNNMFHGCNSLVNIKLSNLNTQNITSMSGIFSGCISLKNVDLSNINTQNVTDMSSMFYGCKTLINVNFSNFDTQNVTNMSNMFYGCNSLEKINLFNFDTKNVINMSNMFSGCKSLININLSKFNTRNVTNMSNMFSGCKSLINIKTLRMLLI